MELRCPSWNLKSCNSFPTVRSHTCTGVPLGLINASSHVTVQVKITQMHPSTTQLDHVDDYIC